MIGRTAFLAMLVTLCVSCSAFVPTAFSPANTRVTRTPLVITEACRLNAKKEKRARNVENMRRFKKAPAAGGMGGRKKKGGKSVKSATIGLKRAAAKERENEFVASLFMFTTEEAV